MIKAGVLKKCTLYLLFSLTLVLICFLFFMYFESNKHDMITGNIKPAEAVDCMPEPTVVIDPGHGGVDGGCVGSNGTTEKDINLSLSEKTYSLLSTSGMCSVMTRTEDELLYDKYNDLGDYTGKKKIYDVKNRVRITEENISPIFISIHMNSFPDKKYSGTQVYFSPNSKDSKLLAETLQSTVTKYIQVDNTRAIKKANSSIYVLDRLTCPAVLIECGFLSNDEECILLNDDIYQKKMAVVFCASILNFTEDYVNQG